MAFVDASGLQAFTDGRDGTGIAETGIVVPLSRIIADLEQKTGEVFDLDRQIADNIQRGLADVFQKVASDPDLTKQIADPDFQTQLVAAVHKKLEAGLLKPIGDPATWRKQIIEALQKQLAKPDLKT